MSGRRIVSIWLHQFPTERWRRGRSLSGRPAPDDVPLALAREGAHGPVIHAVNHAARSEGVRIGARVTDTRALCPQLVVEPADPPGDAAALGRLALWCRRWCPWSAPDGADAIVLDATGSSHLWGGEAAMLETITAALAGLGHHVRLAIAPTHGAAWALARHALETPTLCEAEEMEDRLAGLPVGALRLDKASIQLLHRLGLKTIGALAEIPRLSLARRFARDRQALETPLLRLDQAFGRRPEPVVNLAPIQNFRATIRLAEPVNDIGPHLPGMAEALCVELAKAGFGARRLRLEAFRVDGEVGIVEVATARPTRRATHLIRLFEGRFDTLDPGFGFDAMALRAIGAEPLSAAQARLDRVEDSDVAVAQLIDRLTARLGPQAVTRPELVQSHLPDRAERWVGALDAPALPHSAQPIRERPLRLLDPPEEVQVVYALPEGPPARFVWRRLAHRVTRYEGPERIAPEWWRERSDARLRDYYRVEDSVGRRYWLFRNGTHDDRRGDEPRWFMHGLFA